MKARHGDLIDLARRGDFDLIAHGCNCFCTMGAGIAKGIRAAFPEAYDVDLATTKGDKTKLGTCTAAEVVCGGQTLVVVNAYTQYDYRGRGMKLNYDAVRSCMSWIRENHGSKRIGFPKIGAGLAGGDWDQTVKIIAEELAGEDVTIVEFKPVE
jgi:O-acetyl-ADP-ribose deacetylase (regulator of RNase III)